MSATSGQTDVISRQLARRPAVGAALAFIAGIVLARHLPVLPWVWLALAALLLASAVANHRFGALASASLAMALVLIGLTLAQLEAHRFRPADIAHYTAATPRLAQLELRIDHPPRILSREFDAVRPLPPRQTFTAGVLRARERTGWRRSGGRIVVQLDAPHPSLSAGQIVRIHGILSRPAPAMNPGEFDRLRYYRDQRIIASLHSPGPSHVTVVGQAAPAFGSSLRRVARDALALGFTTRQSLDHALLRALLLGDSDPETRDVQEQFRRTGTSHHLAISGLHIAVLGGFVLLVCRLANLRPRLSAPLVGAFIVLYGIAALPSPPVVRSVLLCLSIGIGVLGRRSIDLVQLLALSALAMLIVRPLDLFNAGFQLSFGTVLGLVLLTRPILAILNPRDDPAFEPPIDTRARAVQALIRTWWWRTLAAALAAWLVSLPLVAYHFDRLNPWAMFGSIVLAPVVFLALIVGFFKVILSLLLPSAAPAWAAIAAEPMRLMRAMVDLLERLPGSDLPLPAPSPAFIALYYLALAGPLLIPALRSRLAPAARLVPALCALLLLCLPLLRR